MNGAKKSIATINGGAEGQTKDKAGAGCAGLIFFPTTKIQAPLTTA